MSRSSGFPTTINSKAFIFIHCSFPFSSSYALIGGYHILGGFLIEFSSSSFILEHKFYYVTIVDCLLHIGWTRALVTIKLERQLLVFIWFV
ncbi:hypothetical protein HanXRQr2_Chr06g0245451 [Helianthus annuus]|uniref:Uncharacterized protein n=1 Tax=Helianthus annuus TaxID=4232 RepID=A0A251UHB6_HELAN|nr:hypothetical protein HanXRQr2_Chr06g0245451 [Helianthus annuus]